jgi:hypothetical protein
MSNPEILSVFVSLVATLTTPEAWGSVSGNLGAWLGAARRELGRELAAGRPVASLAEELAEDAESNADAPDEARDVDATVAALWWIGLPLWLQAARFAGEEAAMQGEGGHWPAQSPTPIEEALRHGAQQPTLDGMPRELRDWLSAAFVEAHNAIRDKEDEDGEGWIKEDTSWEENGIGYYGEEGK